MHDSLPQCESALLAVIDDAVKPIRHWLGYIEQDLGSDDENELWRLSCLDWDDEDVVLRVLTQAAFLWNAARHAESDAVRTALAGLVAEAARLEAYARGVVTMEGKAFRFADLVKR